MGLQAPVFSPLIKPGKNAENADSVSQPPRVSVLLYPHIIRERLTMASQLEERAVRQWLARVAGAGPKSRQALLKLTRCLTWILRGMEEKRN